MYKFADNQQQLNELRSAACVWYSNKSGSSKLQQRIKSFRTQVNSYLVWKWVRNDLGTKWVKWVRNDFGYEMTWVGNSKKWVRNDRNGFLENSKSRNENDQTGYEMGTK